MKAGRRMAARPAFFLAGALVIIWTCPVLAKTTALDDSGTQALEPSVSLRWKAAAPSRAGADNAMVGTTTVRVRINVTPWLHRTGRIYLTLPAQQPGPLTASWVTQGRFMPGRVQSGNRALLYAGPIASPFMEDVMKIEFAVDGALMQHPVPVTFRFEMDEG